MLLNRDELATIARDGIGGLLPRLIDEIEALESAPSDIDALKSDLAALTSRVNALEARTVAGPVTGPQPQNVPQPGPSNG